MMAHCPSQLNSAEIASLGSLASDLIRNVLVEGPEFLQQEEVNSPRLPKTACANLDNSPVAISEIKRDLSNGVGDEAPSTHVHLLVGSRDGVVALNAVISCEAYIYVNFTFCRSSRNHKYIQSM